MNIDKGMLYRIWLLPLRVLITGTAQQHSFDDAIASDRRNADAHNWVQLPAALSFNVSRQADIDR